MFVTCLHQLRISLKAELCVCIKVFFVKVGYSYSHNSCCSGIYVRDISSEKNSLLCLYSHIFFFFLPFKLIIYIDLCFDMRMTAMISEQNRPFVLVFFKGTVNYAGFLFLTQGKTFWLLQFFTFSGLVVTLFLSAVGSHSA